MDYKILLDSGFRDESGLWSNRFWPVPECEIVEAETRLGVRFAAGLREFYQRVGCGFLRKGCDGVVVMSINRILAPSEIVELYFGQSEVGPPEGFDSDELPVFEVGNDMFLVMHPWRENSEGVFDRAGELLASGFAEFVEKMYFEGPEFYLSGY